MIDGSRLLGTTFPRVPAPTDDGQIRSWSALLLVEGDPVDVFNAYLDQAQRSGLSAAGSCEREFGDGKRSVGLDAEPAEGDGPGRITCTGAGRAGEWVDPGNRWVGIDLRRSERGTSLPWASHLTLSFTQRGSGNPPPGTTIPDGSPPRQPPPGRPLRPAPPEPSLPEVGEAVSKELTPEDRPVEVVEGSELIAPPGPLGGVGGYEAVLMVTGDPGAVVAAYAREFEQSFGEGTTREGEVQGRRVIEADHQVSGGGTLVARAVVGTNGEPTFLLIARANG